MNIKFVLLASALLLSVATFSQKDQLKAIKKVYEKSSASEQEIAEYKENLASINKLVTGSTPVEEAQTNYFKSVLPYVEYLSAMSKSATKENLQIVMQLLNPKNIKTIVAGRNELLSFERKEGIATLSKGINENTAGLKTLLVNYAVSLNDKQQYKDASLILKSVYELDPKDPEKLYYAANFALNAKDYDLALSEYQELKRINFTGELTTYSATNKENKKSEQFTSKTERDLYVQAGTHEKPTEEKQPSKKPEIIKNIALILVQNGKKAEALLAIQEARLIDPADTSLLMTEAGLYYDMNDIPGYQKLIKEAIDKNPNDASLYYNLGVTSSSAKDLVSSEKYFKKAIEIKPDYLEAYISLAELKLRDDQKFVDQMSKLGTSAADMKKYDVVKANRTKMFNDALPFLEKAYELKPTDSEVSKTLLSVYKAMEMTEKVKAMKAKM